MSQKSADKEKEMFFSAGFFCLSFLKTWMNTTDGWIDWLTCLYFFNLKNQTKRVLEKFMRYINRNAYVVCAIYGRNFCTSARDAFFLLLRNVIRVAVLDNVIESYLTRECSLMGLMFDRSATLHLWQVTDFLLFIGRIVIVGSMGVASFYVFTDRVEFLNGEVPQLNYYLVPVVTIMLGAFFISSVFFSVYGMAIDTIFLCFRNESFIPLLWTIQ